MRQPQDLKALRLRPHAAGRGIDAIWVNMMTATAAGQRRCGVDPAREEAALVLRRVLGDVDGSAAVLAAGRQPLQHAQHDERDGGGNADGVIARQQADEERRGAHQHDGDDERVLAPDDVAEAAEDDGAERAAR